MWRSPHPTWFRNIYAFRVGRKKHFQLISVDIFVFDIMKKIKLHRDVCNGAHTFPVIYVLADDFIRAPDGDEEGVIVYGIRTTLRKTLSIHTPPKAQDNDYKEENSQRNHISGWNAVCMAASKGFVVSLASSAMTASSWLLVIPGGRLAGIDITTSCFVRGLLAARFLVWTKATSESN